MARVTVEDCIDKVENRFELVLLAAFRARSLHNGDEPTVSQDNDKAGVVALREIAEETMGVAELKEDVIKSLQLYQDEDIEDNISEETSPNAEHNAEDNAEDNAEETNETNETNKLSAKDDEINTESNHNDIEKQSKESDESSDLDSSNDISDETVEKSV